MINLDLSYNEILLTEDLEVLEYMNLIVEVNFKGNLCSKKEEPFIEELKKKYPLIQVINGFQVHDPGFRYNHYFIIIIMIIIIIFVIYLGNDKNCNFFINIDIKK